MIPSCVLRRVSEIGEMRGREREMTIAFFNFYLSLDSIRDRLVQPRSPRDCSQEYRANQQARSITLSLFALSSSNLTIASPQALKLRSPICQLNPIICEHGYIARKDIHRRFSPSKTTTLAQLPRANSFSFKLKLSPSMYVSFESSS